MSFGELLIGQTGQQSERTVVIGTGAIRVISEFKIHGLIVKELHQLEGRNL